MSVSKVGYDSNCASTIQCQTYNYLECRTGKCLYVLLSILIFDKNLSVFIYFYRQRCSVNYYWNSTNCLPQKAYTASCTATSECLTSLGLFCSPTEDHCVCPYGMAAYSCDCPSTHFYDSGVGCGNL